MWRVNFLLLALIWCRCTQWAIIRSGLEKALREALERAEVVITTGGLGPTEDDLTKETVALVANAPLEEHADSMARLREYFGVRPMSANQAKQAMLPRGAVAFPNLVGTAPGCATPVGDGRWVLMLPGPPSGAFAHAARKCRAFFAAHERGGDSLVYG